MVQVLCCHKNPVMFHCADVQRETNTCEQTEINSPELVLLHDTFMDGNMGFDASISGKCLEQSFPCQVEIL